MKNSFFLFALSLVFLMVMGIGCNSNSTEDQQKEKMVADSISLIDSLGTEALLDSLAAETDSIREALDAERAAENIQNP